MTSDARAANYDAVFHVTAAVVKVGDIDIAYDTRGSGEPMLLVAGFGMTRIMWDEEFCDALARHGFQVVRLDNRDSGASTRLDRLGAPDVRRVFLRSILGLRDPPPYTLEAMADDALGLMKSLGHPRFHVVGASMGGMIAQTIALDHGDALLSLTSIMSTPGGRRYAFAKLGALRALLQPVPRDPEAQVEHFVRLFRIIGGDGFAFEEGRARSLANALVASRPSTSASARQFVAILDSAGRRRPRLRGITTKTLVVHGSRDPLLPVRGARAMARLIPHAELMIVEGMGHMIASACYASIAESIARVARR